jgi:hypothetical protein
MALRTKTVTRGGWRTLEGFWNVSTTGFFLLPQGAKIRVLHGYGWFSWSNQNQTLNGSTVKKLSVGKSSIVYARMQMNVTETGAVTYDIEPGQVAQLPPEIHF